MLFPKSVLVCPICQHAALKFKDFGRPRRKNAQCPRCGSLERQRAIYLWLVEYWQTNSRAGIMLHVAPEKCLQNIFRKSFMRSYVALDLRSPRATVIGDLTRTPFRDMSFKLVLCSHVLEHIPDDLSAMMEIRRVTQGGGVALIVVPIRWENEKTDEDPTVTGEEERLKRFGQEDHVRYYGRDIVARLESCGFEVSRLDLVSTLDGPTILRNALSPSEIAFLCKPKPLDVARSTGSP